MIASVWVVAFFTLAVEDGFVDDATLRLSVAGAAQLGFRVRQFVGVFLKIVGKVASVASLLSVRPVEDAAGHLLRVALRRDTGIDGSGRALNLRSGVRSVGCFKFACLNRLIGGRRRGVLGVGCDLRRGLSRGVRTASNRGEECNAPTT